MGSWEGTQAGQLSPGTSQPCGVPLIKLGEGEEAGVFGVMTFISPAFLGNAEHLPARGEEWIPWFVLLCGVFALLFPTLSLNP